MTRTKREEKKEKTNMNTVDVAYSFNGSIKLNVSDEVLQDPEAFEKAVLDKIKESNIEVKNLTFEIWETENTEENSDN